MHRKDPPSQLYARIEQLEEENRRFSKIIDEQRQLLQSYTLDLYTAITILGRVGLENIPIAHAEVAAELVQEYLSFIKK